MSEIKVHSSKGQRARLAVYSETLQYYIRKVLNKIGTNDKDITWYICEEGDFPGLRDTSRGLLKLELLSGVIRKPLYGMTTWDNGDHHSKIYISTHAIQTAPLPQIDHLNQLLRLPQTDNLLINVILDEMAHAKTHEDHGKDSYDDLLKKYAYKYYDFRPKRKTVIEELVEKINPCNRKPGIPWKV